MPDHRSTADRPCSGLPDRHGVIRPHDERASHRAAVRMCPGRMAAGPCTALAKRNDKGPFRLVRAGMSVVRFPFSPVQTERPCPRGLGPCPLRVSVSASIVLLSLLFAWALVADRMARWSITAPLAFVVAGGLLTRGAHPAVPLDLEAHSMEVAAEVVLAVLLFLDATEAREYGRLGSPEGRRLLGVAMPVSVALAMLFGAVVFPGTNWWLLAVAALVVMPIDLAPITGFLGDRRIPLRVRAALSVEAGFNDGLISPVFVFCVANLVLSARGRTFADLLGNILKGAALAVVAGTLLGVLARWLVRRAHDGGWGGPASLRTATLALPFLAYTITTAIGGNGFVAAFVTGLWYAPTAQAVSDDNLDLVGEAAQLMSLAVWFVLGKVAADMLADGPSARLFLYALFALTVARVIPVATSLAGTAIPRPERYAIGWLGSRGVTSIVFGLLAYNQLPQGKIDIFILDAMCMTVLLSIILHGVSQEPIARWFQRHHQARHSPTAGP